MFAITFAVVLVTIVRAEPECNSLGFGGCRGPNWSFEDWPKLVQEATNEDECCEECQNTKGCTGFHISDDDECTLYGHENIIPAKALGGECFKLNGENNDKLISSKQCRKLINQKCAEKDEDKKEVQEKKGKTDPKSIKKKEDHSLKKDQKENNKKDKKEDPKPKKLKEIKKEETKDKKEKEDSKESPKKGNNKENNKADKKDIKNAKKVTKQEVDANKEKKEKSQENKEAISPQQKKAGQKSSPSVPQIPKIDKVGKKFVHKVGDGGCRGQDWSVGEWPKEMGDMNMLQCAESCIKDKGCTAIHVLPRPHLEGSIFECLHFGHDQITAVPRLGGACFKFEDTPKASINDDVEETVDFVKPVKITKLGDGMCRGNGWQIGKNWPKVKGYKSLVSCSEECAKLKNCRAFDLSEIQSDKEMKCTLYAHENIIPASGVSGICYVLNDRNQIKETKKPITKKDEPVKAKEEKEKDDEEEILLDEDARYFHKGTGRCRGANWQNRKWPILRGHRSIQECANACQVRHGCTAFDISESDGKLQDCTLYGHKEPTPAYGVPGECYILEDAEYDDDDDDDDEDDESEEDDFDLEDVDRLSKGACRGMNWQSIPGWPHVEGRTTPEACKQACINKKGCTAFDLSDVDENEKFYCVLFGHANVRPASGVPGNCFAIPGAIPGEEIIMEEEGTSSSEFLNLGKGLCRGPNWQDKTWPKDGGVVQDMMECYSACKEKKGCTAFDISVPDKDQSGMQCYLFGHGEVRPASGLSGNCYRMSGRTPISKREDSGPVEPQKGACRGPEWQNKHWPTDKRGRKMEIEDCLENCQDMKGCTAFDIRRDDDEYVCTFYGHSQVFPASAVPGECYILPPKEKTVSNDKDEGVKDLGKGACRGEGWQSRGWPKVVSIGKRLTLKDCVQECRDTTGCTSFDIRKDEEEVVCTMYGHKTVIPASGVPSHCYSVSGKDRVAQKTKTEMVKEEKKTTKKEEKKKYKVPKFEKPKVIENDDQDSEDDEEWLFDPPPPEIRSRQHIHDILELSDEEPTEIGSITDKALKDLKRIYENSVQPLETLFKYKELSNRHFGDPEIFGKPLIVLMGPWSGGKSTMINYLLGTEFTKDAFRAAAEPSPGFNFNIAMHGDVEQELDGTELAAEFTFSSLQKFGQEFLKKLNGKKMPNKLLEKTAGKDIKSFSSSLLGNSDHFMDNAIFAEIPGVLETGSVRKVDRMYPFNDACQWFIDHADLILLVYDYAKLDIGPETEALLDQLKGRENQVRIILNKADEITAEELLKIQGSLVWNVSPLMSSMEPPKLYAGSFWSRPYKTGAPKRLLKAQEQSLLRDIHEAITKRVENRIATARRFAVRVRNHAKMVDCYLTTYHNYKGFLGDKKQVSSDIIENPHKYHIYQGISAMTNISRYDLPDPESYRDFFNLHPLYDFPTLQSTCTFFKGCPINKLDMAIAYELPELITAFKKNIKAHNHSIKK